ncbi:MAG: hypothetical protein ACK50P_10750 [Planctomycetaceae bacterium]|jgi:hypothetical protein
MIMSLEIIERIELIRALLRVDPSKIVAGKLREGCAKASSGLPEWDQFLTISNGGNCGVFDLWSNEDLPRNQFYSSLMPGTQSDWLVIGQLMYEPIAVNRKTQQVVCFPDNAVSHDLGPISHFVADFLFGRRYAEVVPNVEHDPWWHLLTKGTAMTNHNLP